jgi:hypothetical protein
VASTTGHISNEIDILLYDPLDSVALMNREDVYEVFPVESVYGVIQVKSRLNKREISEGLANLASFKRLNRVDSKGDRGFGVLFAYDSDLEWLEISQEIRSFAEAHSNRLWANFICILGKGIFLHGDASAGQISNAGIEQITRLETHGRPDRDGNCLFGFQSMLLRLLRHTRVAAAEIDLYFSLPLTADAHSYSFVYGNLAEFTACPEHGDFQRKIAPEQLEKLINWCRMAEPINAVRAIDLAYGKPGNDIEAYHRQPGDVRIYNPEHLPLQDILTHERLLGARRALALAYDAIQTAGMTIYIPYYYSIKEGIISGCPRCK